MKNSLVSRAIAHPREISTLERNTFRSHKYHGSPRALVLREGRRVSTTLNQGRLRAARAAVAIVGVPFAPFAFPVILETLLGGTSLSMRDMI